MSRDDPISRLMEQIRTALPSGSLLPDGLREDVESMVSGMLARSNLVTREEFDAQAAVLARTRERLKALEARVGELENAAAMEPGISGND